MIIDAFGKQCPMPLMMAKKELDAGSIPLSIKVDNTTAVKNLSRLGKKKKLAVAVEEIAGGFLVSFAQGDGSEPELDLSSLSQSITSSAQGGSGYAVFVSKDRIGEGSEELGYNLIKMALYTLSESEQPPSSLLFMNAGVKLVAGTESQIIENVTTLTEKGCEVLVCGTCLDYYGVKDDLKVGEVSNMYDILERMQEANKLISF